MPGETKRHNLSDWLSLHDLDPPVCRQILDAAMRHVGSRATDCREIPSEDYAIEPDMAWLRVADSMCSFFPQHQSIIKRTATHIHKVRVSRESKIAKAATINSENDVYPTIVFTYSGKMSDLMVVSHEFAHALQIVACNGKFVSPIIRETSAFVGELVLLSDFQKTEKYQYSELCHVWHNDDKKYFISDARKLNSALRDQKASYCYYWNYPIARYLAIEIFTRFPPEGIWTLFEGNVSIRQILRDCA